MTAQRAAPPLTFLASLLFSPVDVVLELDADLPLVGLVSDEGVLHQLLRGWSLAVVLHQAALNEGLKLFRPGPGQKMKIKGKKKKKKRRKQLTTLIFVLKSERPVGI